MFSVVLRWSRRTTPWWLVGLLLMNGAKAADDTLAKVLERGRIVLGVQDHSAPLSYLNESGQHIGYHVDICLKLVKAIQRRLELPDIKVVTVPTNLATRFALLNNNTIDIECAHNAVKSSTLSHALFSHATMVSEIRLMTTTQHADMDLEHLGPRSIGMSPGDSSVVALRTLARRQGTRVTEVYARQVRDVFGLLVNGQAEAVALPLPYSMAQRALAADPAGYVLVNGVILQEPIALMFRLNDESLQALANEVLVGMMKSGEMARLYEKWFMKPIPGFSQAIGLPMPPVLRTWFEVPGSEMKTL